VQNPLRAQAWSWLLGQERSRENYAKAITLAHFGKTKSRVATSCIQKMYIAQGGVKDSGLPAPGPKLNASLGVAQGPASRSSLQKKRKSLFVMAV
jgi:hypothetical protein